MSKRGNTALNGILLIDKAQGWTSHDVVAKLRKLTGEGRIGHGGTLDPEATGLLVVLFGPATKLSDNLLHGEKSYRATISFGEATDTDDAAGRIVQRSAVGPQVSDADFARKLLEGFVGVQWQTPPAFSALKREGKVAYREARKGRILDIAPRE
ncbi:MAG: tRNA pseudouridine(55) synthase TruB, partial [Actinomycetes bacterium]|nr:tRNA pseudouridine(55) synthase TruB [Actinomycetes bacterium]